MSEKCRWVEGECLEHLGGRVALPCDKAVESLKATLAKRDEELAESKKDLARKIAEAHQQGYRKSAEKVLDIINEFGDDKDVVLGILEEWFGKAAESRKEAERG